MKRSKLTAGAFLLAASFLSTGEAIAQRSRQPQSTCPLLWVTSDTPGRAVRARTLRFPASRILDLVVQVMVPVNSASARGVEVKMYTPKGHLYQTLSVASGDRSLRPPSKRARYQTVSVRLPVAGSTIVQNSLYGTWRAEAYFEGEATACARPRKFAIEP
jgi:hypothetical protein